jgi:hypothetical protein
MAVKKLTNAIAPDTSIVDDIQARIADNNSGEISAADIRENMVNIAESIIPNVASGDFDITGTPFLYNIALQKTNDPEIEGATRGGTLIVDGGVRFNTPEAKALMGTSVTALTQTVPYPGPGSIEHNTLSGLDEGNPHPQYLPFSGGLMLGDLGMGGYDDVTARWISSKGPYETTNILGIYFENVDATNEIVHLGSGTKIEFDYDNSQMKSAVGMAHAFIRFDATVGQNQGEDITVLSSYNINQIKRIDQGKFEIYFKSEASFDHGNYVVVAHSNGTSDDGSIEDMDLVNAASVQRSGEVFSLVVRNDNGEYVDAKVNDIVVYGIPSGVQTPDVATVWQAP